MCVFVCILCNDKVADYHTLSDLRSEDISVKMRRCRQGLEIHGGTSLTSLNECHLGTCHSSPVMGETNR